MKENLKELLLKDLCARLPYGVVLHHIPSGENTTLEFIGQGVIDGDIHDVIENFKPYLRSMYSMTEKERAEVEQLIKYNRPSPYGEINNSGMDNLLASVSVTSSCLIDWLNEHHFDFRNLIGKKLAIEAPEGMY